jgi:uncharacterized delta-60 repeat protein
MCTFSRIGSMSLKLSGTVCALFLCVTLNTNGQSLPLVRVFAAADAIEPKVTPDDVYTPPVNGSFRITREFVTTGDLRVWFGLGGSAIAVPTCAKEFAWFDKSWFDCNGCPGGDYHAGGYDPEAGKGSAVIPDGKTEVLVTIFPLEDVLCENNPHETITISLLPDAAYQLYDVTTASITLVDKPVAGVIIYGGGTTAETGPALTLTVERTCGYFDAEFGGNLPEEKRWLHIFGTALPTFGTPTAGYTDYTISGIDWLTGPGKFKWKCFPKPPFCSGEIFAMAQVTLEAGQASKTITLAPYDDSYAETSPETINIGTWKCPSTFYNITDDDAGFKGWPSLIVVPLNAAVVVKWELVPGFTKYAVKKATSPTGPFSTIGTVTFPPNVAASFIDSSVVNGTTYYYRVVTVDSQGQEGPVQPYTVDATPQETAVVSASAPTDLAIEAGQNGLFRLSRSGTTSGSLEVIYRLAGTATPGIDFTDIGRSATILNGNTSVDKTITALLDGQAESECVEMILVPNPAAGYDAGVGSAVVAIRDAGLGCYAPVIIRQPADQSVLRGSSAPFSVVASGTGLTYQWRSNGVDISGATASTYTKNNVQFSDAGTYSVHVTGTCGTLDSQEAYLTVRETGTLDLSFTNSASFGANATVRAHVVQSDGKIIIAGDFTQVNGVSRNYIARLNVDGSLDTSYTPSLSSSALALAIQPDNKVWVSDTSYNLARLHSTGTTDLFIVLEDGGAYAIAVQPDGKVVVGGTFIGLYSENFWRIVRLLPNGTIDHTFQIDPDPNFPGANGPVYALAIQTDGKILVGGDFTMMGHETYIRRVRLSASGTPEDGFWYGLGADGAVYSIAVQSDGKILMGGNFTTVEGVTRNHLARLNADGTLDTTFGPSTDYDVKSLACRQDGKIYIGGYFAQVSGVGRSGIARLYSDGTVDLGFNPPSGPSPFPYVTTIGFLPNGKIFIGGHFTTYDGVARNRIARVFAD